MQFTSIILYSFRNILKGIELGRRVSRLLGIPCIDRFVVGDISRPLDQCERKLALELSSSHIEPQLDLLPNSVWT